MLRTVAPLALVCLTGACTLMPEDNVFDPGFGGVRPDPAGAAESTTGQAPETEPSDAPTGTTTGRRS